MHASLPAGVMAINSLDLDNAVIIALGSNLPGDFKSSEALLDAAVERFPAIGLSVVKRSSWWRSAAWPDPNAPQYRNGVAIVETIRTPREVLAGLLDLESEFGRCRGERHAPRTLDLDLIAYGREVRDQTSFQLPHPRAHERRFVMGPLAQIAPDWRHPASGKSARELLAAANVGIDATVD